MQSALPARAWSGVLFLDARLARSGILRAGALVDVASTSVAGARNGAALAAFLLTQDITSFPG